METIQYCNSLGSLVLSPFLAASKVFIKSGPLETSHSVNVENARPVIVRYLFIPNELRKGAVKWNYVTLVYVSLGNGVVRGGVLSPVPFAVYLNPLL